MTTDEALRQIDALAEDGALVWMTRRPRHMGGGYTIRVIGSEGRDRHGRGATLAEAVADVMRGRVEVSA